MTFRDSSAVVALRELRDSAVQATRFFTFDARLAVAARREGLEVH